MKLGWVLLATAVLLVSENSQAATRDYVWLDVGGMLAIPDKGSHNELGAGFAFSTGADMDEFIQAGGRLRLARVTERTCSGPAPPDSPCDKSGYAWRGTHLTLGFELRLRISLSQRWTATAGGSVSLGTWFAFGGDDTCCDLGPNVAADVRIAYRLAQRFGVHLAFEEQLQSLGSSENLIISAFWVGLNW